MSDQQQRTTWALDLFVGFVKAWTPPAMQASILGWDGAASKVGDAIRAIAPKDDGKTRIGWAVFSKRQDRDYDRERPSGYVYAQESAVFENPVQADNAHKACVKRGGEYIICEIREIP